jgi:hypothetical protein
MRAAFLLLVAIPLHGCGFPTLADDVLLGWYMRGAATAHGEETGEDYTCGWEITVTDVDSVFTTWTGRVDVDLSSHPNPPEGQVWRGDLSDQPLTLQRNADSLVLKSDMLGVLVAVRDGSQHPQPAYRGAWTCPEAFPQGTNSSGTWTAFPLTGDRP